MDQFETEKSGGFNMSRTEDSDHRELTRLLQEAKPLTRPLFPDQQKKWAAESPLAQEISVILVKHPEYYDEIRTSAKFFLTQTVKPQRRHQAGE
jgi:hypothetical protein